MTDSELVIFLQEMSRKEEEQKNLRAALVLWYLISLGYTAYGFSDVGAEALAWATIFVPFIVYGFFSIVWGQAKHNVWKRENELE